MLDIRLQLYQKFVLKNFTVETYVRLGVLVNYGPARLFGTTVLMKKEMREEKN